MAVEAPSPRTADIGLDKTKIVPDDKGFRDDE